MVSGDKLSQAGEFFHPRAGDMTSPEKKVISSDQTIFQKIHHKNTKKPTGRPGITILIFDMFFSPL